jgi:DNA polymerase
VRGQLFNVTILGISLNVVPTLHPAAALYNPQLKSYIEADFRKIKELIHKDVGKKGLESYF